MIISCNTIVDRRDQVQYLTVSKSYSDNCTCSLTEQNTTLKKSVLSDTNVKQNIILKIAIRFCLNFFHYKYRYFPRRSMAANSTDPVSILPNFEPIQAFIAVLVTCKNEEDPIKIGGARLLTRRYVCV